MSIIEIIIWLYIAVVVLALLDCALFLTGWWRKGGPKYGHQEKRSWALARWRRQAPAEEAEEREEVA